MRRAFVLVTAVLALAWPASAAPARFAPPKTVDAVDLGPLFRGAQASLLGMDGAYSVPFGPEGAVWFFGDTLVGRFDDAGRRKIERMPANSSAMVVNSDWVTGFGKASFMSATGMGGDSRTAPGEILKVAGRPPGRRLWPLDVAYVNEKLWLWFVEIQATGGGGPLDFKVTGVGAARWVHEPRWLFEAKDVVWADDAPLYGSSVLTHQGKVYLYAGGAPTRLARVAPDKVTDRAAHEYWTGTGWSKDPGAAYALPGSGPELSVRANPYLGGFVMTYVPPFGKTVNMRFAPTPEGPWGEAREIARCQPVDAVAMFYGAKQHAELDTEGGRRLVITYNTNATPEQLDERPDLYWPRALRVTLTR